MVTAVEVTPSESTVDVGVLPRQAHAQCGGPIVSDAGRTPVEEFCVSIVVKVRSGDLEEAGGGWSPCPIALDAEGYNHDGPCCV